MTLHARWRRRRANDRRAREPRSLGLRGLRAGFKSLALVALLALFVPGCATEPDAPPPTFSVWQQNLEQYVWDHGNGDPNVLADMSWDDVHKGFAVIGDALPDRSTDEIGLLLAHRKVDGKPWFVFLVGAVRQQNLEDLRPVALNVEGAQFHWCIGAANETALSLYRVWSEADRSRPGPQGPAAPPFPRPAEMFEVTLRGDAFIIHHQESGAQWELRLRTGPDRP